MDLTEAEDIKKRWQEYKIFPDSSVGKESSCNAGDPVLIPGLGRSAGKGIGKPLQYLGASLVAQLVKNTQKSSMKNILMIQITTMVLLLT